MRKIKTVHIHTDYKFVSNTEIFIGDKYENKIIIIKRDRPYPGPFKDDAVFLDKNNNTLTKVLEICNSADLVILYDLDTFKQKVALSLPGHIKIAWRFFGAELYSKRKDLFLSNKTKQHVLQTTKIFSDLYLNPFKNFYHLLKHGVNPKKLFLKSLLRIDFMIVLSKDEYEFLSNYWNLPEFIKHPHFNFKYNEINLDEIINQKSTNPAIVIGNNRLMYNNHLDIIEEIEKIPQKSKYKFIFLFNYGPNEKYAHTVRNFIKDKNHYQMIDELISPDKFDCFYQNINGLVMNSYRQMGGANIFLALLNGVKVYLNKKNILYTWLQNEGFKIFSIENFKTDLMHNQIIPEKTILQYNFRQLIKFSEKYTNNDFQINLYDKLK